MDQFAIHQHAAYADLMKDVECDNRARVVNTYASRASHAGRRVRADRASCCSVRRIAAVEHVVLDDVIRALRGDAGNGIRGARGQRPAVAVEIRQGVIAGGVELTGEAARAATPAVSKVCDVVESIVLANLDQELLRRSSVIVGAGRRKAGAVEHRIVARDDRLRPHGPCEPRLVHADIDRTSGTSCRGEVPVSAHIDGGVQVRVPSVAATQDNLVAGVNRRRETDAGAVWHPRRVQP